MYNNRYFFSFPALDAGLGCALAPVVGALVAAAGACVGALGVAFACDEQY